MKLFSKDKKTGEYYVNSTQEWLPINTIKNGLILLKDGRYIKIIEVLPVNFYLKSEVEQENIIFYFASYLKIAPDNLQIRVITQRADIAEYITRFESLAEKERNEACKNMIENEMNFVGRLSDNTAVKKRFFIVFEFTDKSADNRGAALSEAIRYLNEEAYKAEKYLAQCGLEVLSIDDDGLLIDLLHGMINKNSSKYLKPGNFATSMFGEVQQWRDE